jgi:hypothetical protein
MVWADLILPIGLGGRRIYEEYERVVVGRGATTAARVAYLIALADARVLVGPVGEGVWMGGRDASTWRIGGAVFWKLSPRWSVEAILRHRRSRRVGRALGHRRRPLPLGRAALTVPRCNVLLQGLQARNCVDSYEWLRVAGHASGKSRPRIRVTEVLSRRRPQPPPPLASGLRASGCS